MNNNSFFTPREIVSELDKYIIGQDKAKRSVSIALRNRWRRQNVSSEMRDEIVPKNILMMGPTGVGKTEIARRLAKLSQAPFIKVEASKFTEVGYMGRDVESMIRDLTEIGVKMVSDEESKAVRAKAEEIAEERMLDLLLPSSPEPASEEGAQSEQSPATEARKESEKKRTKEKLRKLLREGKLDDKTVEVEISSAAMPFQILGTQGVDEIDMNLPEMLGNLMPKQTKRKKVDVPDAMKILIREESQKLVDMDKVVKLAIERVENTGIIFIDEIDKIAGGNSNSGPDVSREGVQRDLLPIIEGSTVNTKHGMVKTDHIMFIGAGAFHVSKPSDLIPEIQGRFPVRVELEALGKKEMVKILTETKNALTKQYVELLKTEDINLVFKKDAIEEIARIAMEVNSTTENIGARRLHTILETILDEISFQAPDMTRSKFDIDAAYVREKISEIASNKDLSKYIL
ncbi:MAG: ATP-dependent protease ATPase subunit HslU [Candidatus Mycalebacterium zealandia]|nr:MAG: ATP-dependent protease ATPase subunit HslU [Candidatus Mycalebacterium zealandia]